MSPGVSEPIPPHLLSYIPRLLRHLLAQWAPLASGSFPSGAWSCLPHPEPAGHKRGGRFRPPCPQSPPCSLTAAAIAVTLAPPRYEFEGDKEDVLANMYQFNLAIQLYGCLLENATSEQASRMTAMDSATSNALDLVSKLTIVYNRRRQAKITTELTEIVAGAESV